MKFALLGSGGCFGINCAQYLLAQGHEVIGCGRSALRGPAFDFGVERSGFRYRQFLVGQDNEFIVQWLDEEKPQVIINFAAQGEGAASYLAMHWKYFYATNLDALVDLTERLLGREWLQRWVQVGTSEVYGSVGVPSTEESPVRPSSPYAVSKLAFDQHLMSIAATWGFPAIVCRPSNCMTPGQQLHRIVPKTFVLALTGRRLPLHGGGLARKSYLDAEDLSRALLLLSQRGPTGQIFNVGPMAPVSIRILVAMCLDVIGKKFDDVVDIVPDRTGQDSCYWLDSSKITKLGWSPEVSRLDAVKRVGNWVAENIDVLAAMPVTYSMRA